MMHESPTPRDLKREAKKMPAGVQWPFIPRPMQPDDEGLIYGTWLGTMRNQAAHVHQPNQIFRRGQTEVIASIIAEPKTEVMVASAPSGEPKFGFVVGHWGDEQFVLHYILTKPVYQRKNIASALLQYMGVRPGKTPMIATHWTADIRRLQKKWNITYNPWLAWRIGK
jgi:hypothetical protein